MSRTPPNLALCLLAALLLCLASPALTLDHSASLSRYQDGSEMNARIMSEFLSSPLYQTMGHKWSSSEVSLEFEVYRTTWVERMINFVIAELKVDSESAKRVRQNPNDYMVNYETFKLLSFK